MIYLFDKDEKLIKIVRKSAVKTALQKYALTTERYVSDRLTVELKGLNADELEQVEYMAIQTMEDAHTFHYFYVAQKFSDSLTTLIGVQSGIEELRKSPVYDKRPKNAFARDVITDLLAGTNWQARFVGETAPHSTNFYYTSVFDALKKVCVVWDLEMQFFVEMNGNRIGARYIDFKQKIGQAVGKRVVYGHNALQILQEVERTNIFTALVGRGKGEETGDGYGRKITFEDVVWSRTQGKPVDKPKGQKYLELPLMTQQYGIKNADGSMRPKIGFVDFSEEENPEVLIERTYKALIDAARPQLTLKTSSVYLRGVKVGDTIRVVRHDKKLDYDTRVFEITFNRLNNQSSDIKLGDRIGESNEAKVQTIADKAVEQFVNNEFSNFVQNLPDYLPSADGFNNNWYGAEDPTVQYPGKVLINDIWYKPDPEHEGHKIMLRWTGEVWEEILRTYESESLRDRIAEETAKVNQSMQAQSEEHDRQVANILSKTQSIESLANQAKSDAASALARANQVKTEAIADARAQVATVSQVLNTAKTELQSAIASADQKARDSQASATALRNDLNQQAQTILAQARAQTALTNRVTSVETLADGTRSTVAELSKTVAKATGDITSVTSRTKTVEDTLTQTRTQYEALTQTVNAQTGQIDSINQKTADLQSGIDGVTERFESLQIGGRNYFRGYNHNEEIALPIYQNVGSFIQIYNKLTYPLSEANGKTFTISFEAISPNGDTILHVYNANENPQYFHFYASTIGTATNAWKKFKVTVKPITRARYYSSTNSNRLEIYAPSKTGVKVRNIKVELGTIPTDWSPAEEDLRSEIATYKRSAEESSAELSRQIQLADGKAVEAKSYAQQTATAIDTRLESLETYKDGEGARASQYLSASQTETAKQITAERTAIANNYVAKSTYDENVRGTTLKLNEIKTTADTAKQNLATYQNTVDRKLEELTSSTQTLDGKINTASSKVDTVAGQIRTELSEVEGKIPTEIDGRNLFKGSRDFSGVWHNASNGSFFEEYKGVHIHRTKTAWFGKSQRISVKSGEIYTFSFYAKSDSENDRIVFYLSHSSTGTPAQGHPNNKYIAISTNYQRYSITIKIASDGIIVPRLEKTNTTGFLFFGGFKLETGAIPTGWSPAPEDVFDELSSIKTTITQTASGVEQLSTSLATTDSKVTTAETEIRQLISDVSSKVSQTDYNTLTGRVDDAETAITQNATEISKRLTSTQVDKTITDKGYQTKSDVDNNITGRGYITSSALQPYALSTTVQNLVQETADSFSRTISETKALLPTETGGRNYIFESRTVGINTNNSQTCPISKERLKDGSREFIRIRRSNPSLNPSLMSLYTEIRGFSSEIPTSGKGKISFKARASTPVNMNVMGILISSTSTNLPWNGSRISIGTEWQTYSFDFEFVKGMTTLRANPLLVLPPVPNLADFYLDLCEWQLEAGTIASSWSPAPEDLATVTALHSVRDTVDSHTRTIGAVGTAGSILDNVSKVTQTAAGLVQEVSGDNGLKTQVSTLAGSYAIKNLTKAGDVLGQINLNKDGSVRINEGLISIGERTYIKDGVISAAKIGDLSAGKITSGTLDAARIKANSIDGSKLAFDQAFFNGLTANEAYLEKLFAKNAFATSVQAVTLSASKIAGGILTATNEALKMDLNNGQISFLQDSASIRRASSRSASQFMRFEDSGLITMPGSGISAAHTILGSNYLGSESSGNAFAGFEIYSGKYESLSRVVGDRIEFRANQGNKNLDNGNWVMDFKNRGDSYFYPQKGVNTKNTYLGHMNSRITNVYVEDINLHTGHSLNGLLHNLASIAGHIVLGGFSDDTYKAIKNTYNDLRTKGYG
ncbi:TPA: phage tail protein [Streptococcus suis]|nr:phage tail protein [Streptococcus suis]